MRRVPPRHCSTLIWQADTLNQPGLYRYLIQGAFGDAANPPTRFGCGGGPPCPATTPLCENGVCVAPTCEQARPYCANSTVAGLRARQLCPITCGCSHPRSSLALALPESGCGERCLQNPIYIDALATLPCTDIELQDPDFQVGVVVGT